MWLQCQRHFWRMKSYRFSVEEEVSSGSFSSAQFKLLKLPIFISFKLLKLGCYSN